MVDEYKNHPPIIRELLVPIIRNKKVMAILCLGNRLIDYTNENVVMVQRIANTTWETIKRKQAEEKLLRNQDHLEELVIERTKDIEAKNKELERFNKLFVGREFRIKELRERVKELEKKLQNK